MKRKAGGLRPSGHFFLRFLMSSTMKTMLTIIAGINIEIIRYGADIIVGLIFCGGGLSK